MPRPFIAMLALGGLLAGVAWGRAAVRRRRRKKAAVFVLPSAKPMLNAKIPVLSRLLAARVTARGLHAVRARNTVAAAFANETPAAEAGALQQARLLGADYALVVSIHDLGAHVSTGRPGNIANLRMQTTLCVNCRMLETVSGRLLSGQTITLCRRTRPIVCGTAVGSDTLDALLDEMAEQISGRLDCLRTAA